VNAQQHGRHLVAARDEGVCIICRRGGAANWHHRKLRSHGGDWNPSNGILLCGSGTTGCHGRAHAEPAWARLNGFIVPSWADPAEYPLRYWLPTGKGTHRLGWVRLDMLGGMWEVSDDHATRFIAELSGVTTNDKEAR
jgi:hypothetical protein